MLTIPPAVSKHLEACRIVSRIALTVSLPYHHPASSVPSPPAYKLNLADVYDPKTNKPRQDILKMHFTQEGRIEEAVALRIINEGAALLRQEKTMIDIEAPVTGKRRPNEANWFLFRTFCSRFFEKLPFDKFAQSFCFSVELTRLALRVREIVPDRKSSNGFLSQTRISKTNLFGRDSFQNLPPVQGDCRPEPKS